MKYTYPLEIMDRLLNASVGSVFRLHVERTVGAYFKSTRYLTSQRLVDGIVLTLLFNKEISPDSGNEALAFIQSKSRSFYTSVEREYLLIKDSFLEYAAAVVDNIDKALSLDMRAVNFVVYIMAKDVARKFKLDRSEILLRAFTYSELTSINLS